MGSEGHRSRASRQNSGTVARLTGTECTCPTGTEEPAASGRPRRRVATRVSIVSGVRKKYDLRLFAQDKKTRHIQYYVVRRAHRVRCTRDHPYTNESVRALGWSQGARWTQAHPAPSRRRLSTADALGILSGLDGHKGPPSTLAPTSLYLPPTPLVYFRPAMALHADGGHRRRAERGDRVPLGPSCADS